MRFARVGSGGGSGQERDALQDQADGVRLCVVSEYSRDDGTFPVYISELDLGRVPTFEARVLWRSTTRSIVSKVLSPVRPHSKTNGIIIQRKSRAFAPKARSRGRTCVRIDFRWVLSFSVEF